MNNKPRRAKSLKDPSYKDDMPCISDLPSYSPTHGREISFYTYIAPDPNHAKGWLLIPSLTIIILGFIHCTIP